MIGVKNNDAKKLVAKYDGREYTFEPGVVTATSEDAARHIFGYGERDKTRALLRLGWIPPGGGIESAIERLDKFQFLAVEEVKFKDAGSTVELPRSVSETPASDTPLSPEEEEVARKLAKPEKSKFAGKA